MRTMNLEEDNAKDDTYEKLTKLLEYVIENTEGADGFLLKGGYLLTKMVSKARFTRDIDLAISNASSYPKFRRCLITYGENLCACGIIDRYDVKDEISDKGTGGAKYYRGRVLQLSIDIDLHADSSESVRLDIPPFGELRVVSAYTVLAEKLAAMFSKQRFRRAKDLYDLYLICSAYRINIPHLRRQLASRNLQLLDSEYPFFDGNLDNLRIAWGRLKITEICPCGKQAELPLPDFCKVYTMLEAFVFCVRNDGELGNKPTAKEWNEDGIALWGEGSNS